MGLYAVSKPEINLTAEAIKSLEIVEKLERTINQRPVKDLEAIDALKEIKDTLKTIKEQNDEIIGDEF